MNDMQLKCFLALAETLNFTKASEMLFISQPGLSKQISSLEKELNTQLFIRNQKFVRLSPAGAALAKELPAYLAEWETLLQKVKATGMGYCGSIILGILEGQWVGDELADCCRNFIEKYPNIDFQTKQGSFGELRRMLDAEDADAIITLGFDLEDVNGLRFQKYQDDTSVFALSKRLPIASKEVISLEDIAKETLLLPSPEDCRVGAEMTKKLFYDNGLTPKKIRYAPNLSTNMLWIESGLGVGVISYHSRIASSQSIRLVHEIPLGESPSCIAWRKDNLNPAIALFNQVLQQYCIPEE